MESFKYKMCFLSDRNQGEELTRNGKNTYIFKQFRITLCVIIGNIVVGYTLGWSAPVFSKLKDPGQSPLQYTLSDKNISWIVVINTIGSIFGVNASAYLADVIGRKACLVIFAATNIIACICTAHAWNYGVLLFGRCLAGVPTAVVNSVYIGEIASPDIRGSLLALAGIFHVSGNLLVYSIGPYISYEAVCYVSVALSCFNLITIWSIPESPLYHIMKGQKDKAQAVLLKLGRSDDIDKELPATEDTEQSFASTKSKDDKVSRWKRLMIQKKSRRAFLISTALFCFQVAGGVMTIIFYATTIFKTAQSSIDPNIATIILGVTELCGVISTPLLIERRGRRFLLLISTAGCSLVMGVLGLYFFFEEREATVIASIRWLPLALLVTFLLSYSIGLGIVPNTITAEMYSPSLRSTGASISVTLAWTVLIATGSSFSYLVAALHNYGVFWLYAVINAFGFLFTAVVVPETKGKTLMEIERLLEH